jgi:hypothetical protein
VHEGGHTINFDFQTLSKVPAQVGSAAVAPGPLVKNRNLMGRIKHNLPAATFK